MVSFNMAEKAFLIYKSMQEYTGKVSERYVSLETLEILRLGSCFYLRHIIINLENLENLH
jgi:hypothetical protein